MRGHGDVVTRMGTRCSRGADCFVAGYSVIPGLMLAHQPGMTKQEPGRWSADAFPGLAAAEHAAEGATLHAHGVRALHRDGGVIVAAGVGIVDLAGPFRALRLHADQDFFIGLHGIAAEIAATRFDADVALVLLGRPDANRTGRVGRRSRGNWRRLRRGRYR